MKKDRVNFLLCLLFFLVLAAITFRSTWPPNHVFSASDLNFGRLAAIKNGLPEGLLGGYAATPVLGISGVPSPRVFNWLLSVMPLELFANSFYGIILVFGSLSMIWFLRIWGRSWPASVVGALIGFWFNSIMLAAGGHAYKMEVLAFSVLGLCLIEKAIRSTGVRQAAGYALLVGLTVGIMMIEQQDVALLAGLFIGSYTVFRLIQVHVRSIMHWAAILLPIAVIALMLSGSTVSSSYKRNIKGAAAVQERSDGSEKWNYITQWSMVPSEWPDLIAFGWSGWSSNNPEGLYWGKIGQSADWESAKQGFRNFKLTSVYFGVIPFLLGICGVYYAFRNRKDDQAKAIMFWSIAGLIGFLLAFGKYSVLYKLFYQLPMVGNIRVPMKFMDNFQICLGIVAAYGFDQLAEGGKKTKFSRLLWIAGSILTVVMLAAGLKVLIAPTAWKTVFTDMGFAASADVMIKNMSNAWFHASVLALIFTGLVFWVWKGATTVTWIPLLFIVVLAGDSLVHTSRYFKAVEVSALKRGNLVINYLKVNQGDERTFFLDQGGIYNQWLASDGRYHRLKLFNIWQMPRMPVEYREYLDKVGRNQFRLWQLSAVRHIAAPASVMHQLQQNPEMEKQFKPVLNYQVPTSRGMRQDVLLEFAGGVPRFALYSNWESVPLDQHCDMLVSPQHNPQATVLVTTESGIAPQAGRGNFKPLKAEVSARKAAIEVNTDLPAVVRFSQRYEPTWRVFVDGEKADLLRVDYLNMGVAVPPGKHTVLFECIDGTRSLVQYLVVLVLSIAVSGLCLLKRREHRNGS